MEKDRKINRNVIDISGKKCSNLLIELRKNAAIKQVESKSRINKDIMKRFDKLDFKQKNVIAIYLNLRVFMLASK